jgi:hypothetical protein
MSLDATRDIERIRAGYGAHLRGLKVLANCAKPSQFEVAEGHAAVLALDAPLRPDFVHANMNGQKVVALITGVADGDASALSPAYFEARRDALAGAVPEQHTAAARAATIDEASGYDRQPWEPVLGAGSRVGVYRAERADSDAFLFFIAATINETPIGNDAHAHLEAMAARGATVGAYLADAQTRALRQLARRNAMRAVAAVALALGVTIEWRRDLYASHPRFDDAKPLVAEPQAHCEFNVVSRDGDAAHVHDHAVDVYNATNGFTLDLDPRLGVRLYQTPRCGTRHMSNAHANAFPASTARGANALAERVGARRVAWHGKERGVAQPDVRADVAPSEAALRPLVPSNATPLALTPVIVFLTSARDI